MILKNYKDIEIYHGDCLKVKWTRYIFQTERTYWKDRQHEPESENEVAQPCLTLCDPIDGR